MYKVEQVAFDNNFLIISFSSELEQTELNAEFRFKDVTRYLVHAYNNTVQANVISTGKNHEIKLNILDFVNKVQFGTLSNQTIWIVIANKEEYFELNISNELIEQIKKMKAMDLDEFFEINFSHKGNNKLALTIKKKNINFYFKKIYRQDERLIIELPTFQYIDSIELKRRTFKDIFVYSQKLVLNHIKENIYSLNIKDLSNIDFDEVTNLDFIAIVKTQDTKIEFPLLKKEDIQLPTLTINENFTSKLYFTAKNSLSLRVEKKYSMLDIKSTNMIDNTLIAEIDVNKIKSEGLSNIEAGIYRTNRLLNDNEYTLYKSIVLNVKADIVELKVDFNELFENSESNYEQIYTIFLCINNKYYRIGAKESINESVMLDRAIFLINVFKECTITVKPNSIKPVKISILGTCYSRAAFNSSNAFFNKDYKMYFSLEYSHFWISLISAVSPKIEYKSSNYIDLPEKVIGNVKKEYEKSTFKDLQKVDTDYVIIDLFVDAVHGVRRFPDGRFIGQNGDMYKSSYYKNKFLKETSQFDNRHPDFWDTWKQSCDIFIEQLEKVIDRGKVILNLGGLTDSYYNEKGQASSFSKDYKTFNKTDINFINHTWEKMNNYFISRMPEAKVIELNKYNYLASLEYPYGRSGPHHYEENYYKSFLGELSKIVLRDKINQL